MIVEKFHNEDRPDRWIFKRPPGLGKPQTGEYDGYELALVFVDKDGVCEPCNGRVMRWDDERDGTTLTWTVYGHLQEGGVCALTDCDSIHSALDVLVGIGAIAESQKQDIGREWMAENDPVDFETVSSELRSARDMIEVLTEHLVHCTATVADIAKARKMVKEIDALDL